MSALAGSTRAEAGAIARLAVRSLYAELVLYPKPGLVSLVDNGSHTDMNAATFLRSLFALRHYFRAIGLAGMRGADFAELKALGIEAERRMLLATQGVNTHRGAIFCLGLLCAAAGRLRATGGTPTPAALRATLLQHWGPALAGHARPEAADSNGLRAQALYAAGGAREEGALGLPSVFEVALPALRATLSAGRGMRQAKLDALFALMAHVADTNVLHRGGAAGAQLVRVRARRFLALGGTASPGWMDEALACHRLFVKHRLSPGGAADLLAAACFVHALSA
jgi:triphosphoribosyl-dephospho-CoA synthase